jgi:transcriptional regulator with GAF, ATPase, and Fis domain
LLAKYFIERYAAKEGRRIRKIESRTATLLEGHHWPGNIRELQNVIERAMILCDSDTLFVEKAWLQPEAELRVGLRPSDRLETVTVTSKSTTLKEVDRALILQTLEASGWMIGGPEGAAVRLGLKRTTLIYKMKRLGIFRPAQSRGVRIPAAEFLFTE